MLIQVQSEVNMDLILVETLSTVVIVLNQLKENLTSGSNQKKSLTGRKIWMLTFMNENWRFDLKY